MNDAKVDIYLHPNPEIRSFFTSEIIFAHRVEHYKKPLDKNWEAALDPLPLTSAGIIREIMSIKGVKEVYIKPKEVRITKEASSSWNSIQESVVKILTGGLRRKKLRLIKG
jgi:hypothetical protein